MQILVKIFSCVLTLSLGDDAPRRRQNAIRIPSVTRRRGARRICVWLRPTLRKAFDVESPFDIDDLNQDRDG